MSRFFRKPPLEQEVAGEVAFHLEMRVRELMAQGLSQSAARAEARARFGDVEAISGTMHHLGRERDLVLSRRQWLADGAQDMRAALRQLRRAPIFAAAALATLALGIGASTTVFSVANAVLLRPLPFRDPATLVRVWQSNTGMPRFSLSDPDFLDFAARNRVYDGMAAWMPRGATLIGDGDPERPPALAATPSFFPLLGVAPLVGRTFTEAEGAPGATARVAVISRRLWLMRFGGDPAVTTQTLNLDGVSHQIAGVVRDDLDGFGQVDVWLPLAPSTARAANLPHRLGAIARLKPGITVEQGTADLQRIARELAAEYPASNTDWSATSLGIHDWIVGPQLRGRLRVLLGGVALLLLMACVNVANLLMARAESRRRELTVRAALGAGRWRIARQLLAESLVLAFLGAGLGIAFAYAAVPLLRDVAADSVPRLGAMRVDLRVLLFGVSAALATGLLFGTAPALSASRIVTFALRSGARTIGRHLRPALIGGSVALAMMLLSGAALIGGSFLRLTSEDLGFTPEGVLTASVTLPVSRYADGAARARLVDDLLQRLEARPDVEAAAVTNAVPFGGINSSFLFLPAPAADGQQPYQASWRTVSPGYYGTLGIRLLGGRLHDERDRQGAPGVIVISESLARRVWPGQQAVGKRIQVVGGDGESEVIGVVSDARDLALDQEPAERIYLPYAQVSLATVHLLVRGHDWGAEALLTIVRDEVRAADALLALQNPRPLAELVAASAAEPRLTTLIFGLFAAAALVLAVVGLYGLVAYGVSQRTREFGLRLALGARPGRIVRAVLREGVGLAVLGVAAGLGGALALSRFLGAILYGIEPTNAPSYLLMGLLLIVCASVAAFIPAIRAARLPPTVALREE